MYDFIYDLRGTMYDFIYDLRGTIYEGRFTIQDAGCGMPDSGFRMAGLLDARCTMQDGWITGQLGSWMAGIHADQAEL